MVTKFRTRVCVLSLTADAQHSVKGRFVFVVIVNDPKGVGALLLAATEMEIASKSR